jgi:cytochrome P450
VSRFCERQPTLALWQEPFLGDPLPVDGTDDWVGAFQSWIHDLVHEPTRTEAAAGVIAGYLLKVMADRLACPREDIPSLLLQATIGDRCLSEDEVFDYLFMIFGAGVETTAAALGSMLHLLGRRPDLRRRLVTEPEILPAAVEELLRFLGPTQATRRTVLRSTEVRGVSMSAGDPVMLLWGAADRDEDEFPDADRCILDRFPNRHLAFGAGVHRCLGSNLARLEVRLSLQEFLRRIPDYEIAVPDDELEWAVGVDRSLRRLPIVF